MTTLREAARKALKALEVATTPLAKDRQEVLTAMYDLRTALAQQGEQQPVCHGCGIPAGDVHMSTCKSGKWPSRVSNGDTAAPAPQAQDGRYIIAGSVWFRKSTNEWVLELSGSINDTSFVSRHTQPAEILPENVPSLSTLYAPAPQPRELTEAHIAAANMCRKAGRVSVSMVQRKMNTGYQEAQVLVAEIVAAGLVDGIEASGLPNI